MLADTIVRRWQDHCPLNRLKDFYARDGMELSRSTMCGWHECFGSAGMGHARPGRRHRGKERPLTNGGNEVG